MANDPFYGGPLGMPFSENTRRFTVIRPAASGKTERTFNDFINTNATFGKRPSNCYGKTMYDQPVDQAALEQLRDYLMHDLIGAGVMRVDRLPPLRQSIIELQVAVVCANWAA